MQVTAALLALFRERHVYHRRFQGERWVVGDEIDVAAQTRLEPYVHVFGGTSLPQAMGAFSYSQGRLQTDFKVGRYCSLGDGLTCMGGSHPADWASTSPVFFDPAPLAGMRAYLVEDRRVAEFRVRNYHHLPEPISIGNDVWIGMGVTMKAGVTIGDGAVVAARSVVTKDVPPYAIVGGVTAKLIRMRFPEIIVERFLALQPWRFGPDDLQSLNVSEPRSFLDRLEEEIAAARIVALDLNILTGEEIAAAALQRS